MLPLAMNWWDSTQEGYPLWVFFDVVGDDDYFFNPYVTHEIGEAIESLQNEEEDKEARKIIELSMLAHCDPLFSQKALDEDYDYDVDEILNMDFPIKTGLDDSEYYGVRMSKEVRKARGWNAAIVFKLKLPIEHFMLLTDTLPQNFERGSIGTWNMSMGWPLRWNALGNSEMLPFGKLIAQAIKTMRDSE